MYPQLSISKCIGEGCESPEQIEKYLANKILSLTILANTYNTTNYNENEKVQKISRQYAIKLSNDEFKSTEVVISKEILETEDNYLSLKLTSDIKSFQTVPEVLEFESSKVKDAEILTVDFKLNRDIKEHKRTIYGPLDLLGDVGGLADALITIGAGLVAII